MSPLHRYLAAYGISMTGTWAHQVALGWLLVELTGTATALASVALVTALPVVALAWLGGSVADRVDRGRILRVTQPVLGALALTHALLVGTERVQLAHLHVLALATGCALALDGPTQRALLGRLAPRDALGRAVGSWQLVHHGSRLLGPALAGALLASGAGLAWIFALNAGTYLVSTVVLHALGSFPPAPVSRSDPRGALTLVLATPELRRPLALIVVLAASALPLLAVLMPLVVRDVLSGDGALLGLVSAASGLGALLGTFVLLRAPRAFGPRTLPLLLLGCALPIVVMSAGARGFSAVPLVALIAGSMAIALALASTALQRAAPEDRRGRILSLQAAAMAAGPPLGGVLWASVADLTSSLQLAIAALAMVPLLAAAFFAARTGTSLLPREPCPERVRADS